MIRAVLLLLAVLLASCNEEKKPVVNVPPPVTTAEINLTNVPFNTWFSPGMPDQVQWSQGHALNNLHYTNTPVGGIINHQLIRMVLEVTDDACHHVDPNDVDPCKIVLFYGKPDTTWAHLRFWSDQKINLVNGTHELQVPIEYSWWHTVDGTKDQAGFNALFSASANIGFTCGGQSFDGHGCQGGAIRVTYFGVIPK